MSNRQSYLLTECKSDCSGCSACVSACAHEAISMQEDAEGFLYPFIDDSHCIGCGVCSGICPISKTQRNTNFDSQCYLATTRLEVYYNNSATIGICTMLAEAIIKLGGVVFGAWLDESTWETKHVKVVDLHELEKIRNSKYVQSDPGSTFREVDRLLRDGVKVLYVGTPCMIAGLKAFLRKSYDDLFTVDLICHGVYSYKLLQKEVGYWKQIFKGEIKNFKFRSKRVYHWDRGGVVNFDVIKKHNNSEHVEILGMFSPTYRCYAYSGNGINYNLRFSCYKCPFRDEERYGDVTVGDSWFMGDKFPQIFTEENRKTGISLLLINTAKGFRIIDWFDGKLDLYGLDKHQAFVQPALLACDRPIPSERMELYGQIDKEHYGELVGRLLKVDIRQLYRDSLSVHEPIIHEKFKKRIKKYVSYVLHKKNQAKIR